MPFSFEVTQESKPIITAKDGTTKYVDFLHKDINIISVAFAPTIRGYYIIPDDFAMRPDLCCKGMYLYEDGYMEKMLKYNGISNPFLLEGGDVLGNFDPYSMTVSSRLTNNSANAREDVRKQYVTPDKKSQADPRLKEFEQRNKSPKKPTDATFLPANFAAFGDTEYTIREGKVFFGENVTKPGGPNSEPLSKSEFIARLLKNGKAQ